MLAIVLALVAGTTAAVAYLLRQADASRQAQIILGEIELGGHELREVPWKGIWTAQRSDLVRAAQAVTAGPTAEVGAANAPSAEKQGSDSKRAPSPVASTMQRLDGEIERRLDKLAKLTSDQRRPGEIHEVYGAYWTALNKLVPYVQEGKLVEGYFYDQLRVAPRYESLRGILAESGRAYAASARGTIRSTLLGSAFVILAAFATIGVLFARSRAKGRRLAEQNARLVELDQMKDNFLASVSHELRTPLTSILGYLELLAEGEGGELTPDQGEFVTVVNRNADRLLRLVSDLLLVAQVDAGGLVLETGDVDLPTVAREAVEAARPFAEEKGIELRLGSAPVPLLPGDRARLAQALDNLVSNALKFTPKGGRVEVRVARSNGHAVVEVEDTGMGIPADDQTRLFERFFRTDKATQRAVPGTGLGLSIVKAIVEAHRGQIAIESTEGVGTTFRIRLPFDSRVTPPIWDPETMEAA